MTQQTRVTVLGLYNTGTNLAKKLLQADDSAIHIDIEGHGKWKHALLGANDDEQLAPLVDEIVIMTRNPCTWFIGMDKAPYGTGTRGDPFKANPPKESDQLQNQRWSAVDRGDAWNAFYSAATRFQQKSALPVRFMRYEDLLNEDGLQMWTETARGGDTHMSRVTYDEVMSKKAKEHGNPRTRHEAQRVASAGCAALDEKMLHQLRSTIDTNLAASFGYDV